MDGAGEAREDNGRLRQSTKAARCDEVVEAFACLTRYYAGPLLLRLADS
jgi:hypothetical protein